MNCPECNGESIIVKWQEVPSEVGYCPICDRIFILNADETLIIRPNGVHAETEIPELPINTHVFIINKEHKFFLERGVVVEKDHKHYRIKFISLNKDIHDKMLWVPDHWIDPVPKALIS